MEPTEIMNRIFISGEINGEIEVLFCSKGKLARFNIESEEQFFTIIFYGSQLEHFLNRMYEGHTCCFQGKLNSKGQIVANVYQHLYYFAYMNEMWGT